MNISDQKLYDLCKKYGMQTKIWRQKFTGLLPEVYKRKLYVKKGFGSIFEFAAKLAGLTGDQVRLAINLEKRLEDKPILKSLLVNGEVSIHKLSRVVSIATSENEAMLAEQIKILPKSALEVLVKDERFAKTETEIQNKNGLQQAFLEDKDLPGQTENLNFDLQEDIVKTLNELHAKGHDVNGLLRQMLAQRQEQIEQIKNEISETIEETDSRYIPVKIRKVLQEEYGEKCSMKNCNKPSMVIHHAQRYSLSHNHDPKYLAPLCLEHHTIAHGVDQKYQRNRAAALADG